MCNCHVKRLTGGTEITHGGDSSNFMTAEAKRWMRGFFFRTVKVIFIFIFLPNHHWTWSLWLCSGLKGLYLSHCPASNWPEVTCRTGGDASLCTDTPEFFFTDTRIRSLEEKKESTPVCVNTFCHPPCQSRRLKHREWTLGVSGGIFHWHLFNHTGAVSCSTKAPLTHVRFDRVVSPWTF